jgi:hypothetical protein
MSLRPALLTVAALAAALAALTLCRRGAPGNRDPVFFAWEVQRGDELEAHIEAGRRRDEAKRALAAEVVARRLSLREAADHFRRLNEADPGYPADFSRPAADEQVLGDQVLDWGWAGLAHAGRFAAAARWYAEVFTAYPHLLAGPSTRHRYHASCAAALAGCGEGRDASDLDEKSRTGFRRQALGWLRAELEVQRRLLERASGQDRLFIACGLQRWLWDTPFAGVRGPEALARLPAAERQEWQELWADIADALARAVDMLPR